MFLKNAVRAPPKTIPKKADGITIFGFLYQQRIPTTTSKGISGGTASNSIGGDKLATLRASNCSVSCWEYATVITVIGVFAGVGCSGVSIQNRLNMHRGMT